MFDSLVDQRRKRLLCALARNDFDLAKATFFGMSPETQQDPMTQYLMYRVTIRSGDAELASECLQAIAAASNISMELLYACVADSQRVGNRIIVVQAMKKLAEVHECGRLERLHLPALFRCSIMLLHGLLTDKDIARKSVINDLCNMFDQGMYGLEKNKVQFDPEIDIATFPDCSSCGCTKRPQRRQWKQTI